MHKTRPIAMNNVPVSPSIRQSDLQNAEKCKKGTRLKRAKQTIAKKNVAKQSRDKRKEEKEN